jgi:hypothetical protein
MPEAVPESARLRRLDSHLLGRRGSGGLGWLLALAENLANKWWQRLRTPANLEPGLPRSWDGLLEYGYLILLDIPDITGCELMLREYRACRG